MSKYHQPSDPSARTGGTSAPSNSISGNEWSVSCHFAAETEEPGTGDQPPPPRPRWTGEEEDLSLPNALRRKEEPDSPPPAPRRSRWPSFLILTAGPAALAGIMLFLADGAAFLAGGNVANDAISVETTSIAPGTLDVASLAPAVPARATPPETEHVSHDRLDGGRFNDRYEAAKWVDATGNKLREKIQDRMKQDLQTAPDGTPVNTELQPFAQSGPELGYADSSRRNSEAHLAINEMAPRTGKTTRTGTQTAHAAVTPLTASAETSTDETEKPASVTADVNLRKSDQKDAEILAVIPDNSRVDVGDCGKWWCEVSYAGKSGFVGVKFIDTGN